MNIIGKGKSVIDQDLLGKLALASQSGGTVSKAEVNKIIKSTVQDLKDDFQYSSSTRGLTRSADAIRNTLELAVNKGFIRGNSAQDIVEAFLTGTDKGTLDDALDEIRADVRSSRSSRVGYSGGGGRSRRSYTPRTSRYAGT